MASPLHLQESRTYPVGAPETFDRLLPLPLPQLFAHRYAAIAPVRTTDQQGVWGTVGQQRTIHLADGSSMRETLTVVDRPHRFGYDIGGVTGALQPLIVSAAGAWSIEAAGTGSRVTWSWDLVPSAAGRLAMPLFAPMWRGYARRALAELETLLLG